MGRSSKSRSVKKEFYRAGIVGCGRIGCSFDDEPNRGYVSTHAGAYARTPGVELIALADLDQTSLNRYGKKFRVDGLYTDYRKMLSQEQLDILSICTWNETHREIVENAVRAKVKGIFCEKPIAESLASADAMIQQCAENGVTLMIDHQRRFDRFHQDVAAYLREERLGHIQQITCYYTAGVVNTGSHLFDLLRLLFGEVEWVQGIYSSNSSQIPNDPNVDGWLQFDNGVRAAVQPCDVRHYTIFEINILGALGRLRITSHGFEAQFEQAQESTRFADYRELHLAKTPLDPGGPREFMLQAVDHLLGCVQREQRPQCSGEDGRRALEIICALRESADADGRRIGLPLVNSPIVIESR
jgi:predicted dehydrogenase